MHTGDLVKRYRKHTHHPGLCTPRDCVCVFSLGEACVYDDDFSVALSLHLLILHTELTDINMQNREDAEQNADN